MTDTLKSQTVDLEQIKAILERLVGFDTTSHKSNLELIAYLEQFCKQNGVTYHLIPNEEGDKASLFASIGPQNEGGIGLSGHTDVVPVVGQAWDTDPFQLTQKGDKLFGRGTTDMKGFLAVMLASIPLFQTANLKRPVHFLFSYDEEIGCTGVRPMIDRLGHDLLKPEFVLVGEPSNCKVVEAHKSILSFETIVQGFEAHSSVHHKGVNAIEIAAKLIDFLTGKQQELVLAQNEPRFDPPYSTIHVGIITGGTARNIVAKECRFAWEVRALPSFNGADIADAMMAFAHQSLLPAMREISENCYVKTVNKGEVPGLNAHPFAVELGLKIAQQNSSHAVSYGTEAGLFELGGVPSVICGPGNIDQAHKPNEFIDENELVACTHIMGQIADYLENN